MSDYIANRIREGSTHQGLIVGGMGLTQVVLWGALAWAAWSMIKSS
jgi:hypothetical protein